MSGSKLKEDLEYVRQSMECLDDRGSQIFSLKTTCPSLMVRDDTMANFGSTSRNNMAIQRAEMSTSSNTSNTGGSFNARGTSNSRNGIGSNLRANSDAHKLRRKRRLKKKKSQA